MSNPTFQEPQPAHMPTPEELLGGGGSGIQTFKFPNVGAQIVGTVVSQATQQQREFSRQGPGKLLFWDDGNPRMQVVLVINCGAGTTDPEAIGEERRVYVKGQMLSASKLAISQAEATSFEPGGTVSIKYVGDKASGGGFSAKQYEVSFVKAAPGAQQAAAVSQVLAPEPAAPVAQPAEPEATISAAEMEKLDPATLEVLRKQGLIK